MLSQLLRRPTAMLRSVAAPYSTLRSWRGRAASYFAFGRTSASPNAALSHTRLPLTRRYVAAQALALCRKALSWTRHHRGATPQGAPRLERAPPPPFSSPSEHTAHT